ncbi:BrnT family toxin [Methylobacterium sp. J-078]|nr:BrnT family toxin [Methylobacterium sp. J-078]
MTTRFEWDPAKAASNLRKHGIGFESAVRVFADPFLLTAPDRVEGGELRWKAIGSIGDIAVLLVVHTITERDEDGREIEIVRIISARRADRTERRRYERESRPFRR